MQLLDIIDDSFKLDEMINRNKIGDKKISKIYKKDH